MELCPTGREKNTRGTKGTQEAQKSVSRLIFLCLLCSFPGARLSAEPSRLISGILRLDVVLDLRDGQALIVHPARIKRDVLTNGATRSVLVLETEKIVLVAKAGHAAA